MDSLNYFYNTATNQLNHIKDNAEDWIGGGHDLQDQSSNNYGYDPSGNMTKDLSQSIPDGGISWNAYGKILKVYHSTTTDNNPVKQVTYGYDAGGNRISKRVVKTGTKTVNWTWYVRDASGNLMGTYISNGDSTHALTDYDLSKQDQVIYGSSRIGVAGTAYGVKKDSYDEFYYSPWNGVHLWVYKGGDQYELTNHLGNVLVTVGDRKIGVPSAANSSLIDHWKADISSAADYYPFGMVMADRTYQNNYRYGFNGKEKDDDVKGNWNSYDYGERPYDPRVGRFLSVDPLIHSYPWYSAYQFAGNTPIWAVDLDGKEPFGATASWVTDAQTKLGLTIKDFVLERHRQGMANVRVAEQARQQAVLQGRKDGDGINGYTKLLVYIGPWWNSSATFSDANDGAVLMSGHNLDGSQASTIDFAAASVGAFIPFVSGGAISKLFKGAEKGAGKEIVEGILKKVDNISSALDEKHVRAAVNDILGSPVVINGKTYDHLTEVKQALGGLGNQIEKLNGLINSGKLSDDVLTSTEKIRSELQNTKDIINDALNSAEKKAKPKK